MESAGRLVEREAELAALVGALAEPPAIVVVEGEPGIGKTRLVGEALTAPRLAGREALVGEAHPVRDPFPFGPLLDALVGARLPRGGLSPVVGALRALLPERADELPPAPEPVDDARAERHRTVRALIELLGAICPAVLVLEDLHWADEGTIDVLRMLSSRPPEGLAVVVTYRGSDAPPGCSLRDALAALPPPLVRARLQLEPLTVAGVGELAGQLLGAGEVSDEFARHLSERSGGIPFVAEEDLRLLVDRGLLTRRAGVWVRRPVDALGVPPTVGDAVVERAARLSDDARVVLEAAAVLAPAADEAMFEELTRLSAERVVGALSEALATGLMHERGTQVLFRHALARQAIYDAIPGPRLRNLHLAAAHVLEAAGHERLIGQIARHYRAAGDTKAWVRCAAGAAERARSFGEEATAYRYLRELLESGVVAPDQRADLAINLGRTAVASPGELDATIALLRKAIAQDDSSAGTRGELRLLLGLREMEDPETVDAGIDDIRLAVEDLAERPELQARALCMLAIPWGIRTGTLADHLTHMDAARSAANHVEDSEVQAAVAADVAWTLMQAGDNRVWDALESLPRQGGSAAADAHLVRGLFNCAGAALDLGHYERAVELVSRARRGADAMHADHRYYLQLRAIELRARWLTGELDSIEEEAERLGREHDISVALDGDLVRGELLLLHGTLDEAHRLLSSVAERQEANAVFARVARASASLVRVAQTRGDEETARATAEHALDLVAAKQIWAWAAPLMPFAPLEIMRGALDDYRSGIADRDAPLAAAALAFAEGRVAEDAGDRDAAGAAYATAREMYAALADPRMAAHAAAAQGVCRAAVGDRAGAELLRDAWQTFAQLDAPWEAGRIKQLMRGAGLAVPHRRGRRSYGDQLSPREREIAARAAAGRTSREIAEEMFLSPRTVDYHLGNVMRKLTISSRRELGDALASLDGDMSADRGSSTAA